MKYDLIMRRKTGVRHQVADQECEDVYEIFMSRNRTQLYLTVCDGVSDERATRSVMGAYFGCEAGYRALKNHAEDSMKFFEVLKENFNRYCREDLEKTPPDGEELLFAWDLPEDEYIYSSTFGGCVIDTEGKVVAHQLGDGEITVLTKDGIICALPPDARRPPNFPATLVDSEADDLRSGCVDDAAAVIIHTDGCRGSALPIAEALLHLNEDGFVFGDAVDQILDEVDSGDDQTIIIAFDSTVCSSLEFKQGIYSSFLEAHYKEEAALEHLNNLLLLSREMEFSTEATESPTST